jgi:hypothetical protein
MHRSQYREIFQSEAGKLLVQYLNKLKEIAQDQLIYTDDINPYNLGTYRETIRFIEDIINLSDNLDKYKPVEEKKIVPSYSDIAKTSK